MPQASAFAPTPIDFSAIGNLADTYFNAREGAMRRRAFEEDRAHTRSQRAAASAQEARRREIAAGGPPLDANGNFDYAAAAAQLYEIGEFGQAKQMLDIANKQAGQRATEDYRTQVLQGQQQDRAATAQYRQDSLALDRARLEPEKARLYKFYAEGERSAGREPIGFQEFLKSAEAGSFGKNGTLVRDDQGNFYSVQFGSGGVKLIEPLVFPGQSQPGTPDQGAPAAQPQAGPAAAPVTQLSPSRGVQVVGDTLIDKATGQPQGRVGDALERGEEAKAVGRKTGEAVVAKRGTDVGRASVSRNLVDLTKNYMKLDELGGVVNPDRSAIENLSASGSASAAGQAAGRAIGSEAQSVRDRINMMRPLLVQGIRQATGMSARGMDSNRELEFYLQAATDPQRDLYANLAAIQVLDQTFGLGDVLKETLPPDVYARVKQQADAAAAQRPIVVTDDQLEQGAAQPAPRARPSPIDIGDGFTLEISP